jgi:hypothetical protein
MGRLRQRHVPSFVPLRVRFDFALENWIDSFQHNLTSPCNSRVKLTSWTGPGNVSMQHVLLEVCRKTPPSLRSTSALPHTLPLWLQKRKSDSNSESLQTLSHSTRCTTLEHQKPTPLHPARLFATAGLPKFLTVCKTLPWKLLPNFSYISFPD